MQKNHLYRNKHFFSSDFDDIFFAYVSDGSKKKYFLCENKITEQKGSMKFFQQFFFQEIFFFLELSEIYAKKLRIRARYFFAQILMTIFLHTFQMILRISCFLSKNPFRVKKIWKKKVIFFFSPKPDRFYVGGLSLPKVLAPGPGRFWNELPLPTGYREVSLVNDSETGSGT